jgi:hypothetical protein
MNEDWTDVQAAVEACAKTYVKLLASRAEHREGSKKALAAEAAWEEAVANRAQAALNHWTPADGFIGEFKAMAPVIQRYYTENRLPYDKKGKR